jgi:hypothetical protein
MNLSHGIKVTVVEAAAAAGTTELVSDVLDMQGFDGVIFIALLGDVTDTSVLTLTAKGNTANHVSSPTPITQASATFTAGASDADSKALMVDVCDPALRYIFASLTRATANAVLGGIIAIQYSADYRPTSQAASVIASTVAVGVAA